MDDKYCIEAFMKLALMTYTQVEEYLKSKDSVIIPIGSVEQHSPVGLIGTDHLIAEEIAYKVADNVNAIACPTLSYGMSNHHLAFPGTISLNPTTLIAELKNIITSLIRHGFKKFYLINGHGGNIASCEAAFSELTREYDISCKIKSWWMDPDINRYIKEFFGDREGHHATPSEISQTIYFYKKAFDLPIRDFQIDHSKHHWPLSPDDFKRQFPDGRMESDPSLATYDLGEKLFEKSVEVIQKDFLDFERL